MIFLCFISHSFLFLTIVPLLSNISSGCNVILSFFSFSLFLHPILHAHAHVYVLPKPVGLSIMYLPYEFNDKIISSHV